MAILPLWALGVLCFFGVFAHYLKKVVKDKAGIIQYWTAHAPASIMSFIGAAVGFAILYQAGSTDAFAYFLCGYTADSLLNKADSTPQPV